MRLKERKIITENWLKDNKIKFTNKSDDEFFGTCEIYMRESRNKQWQIDIYDKHMDMTLSTWDKNNDMKDIHELMNIPFASSKEQLNSLMELMKFKI